MRLCTQYRNGKPCPNRAGADVLGWCDEHAAAYWTMANNLRNEIDALKVTNCVTSDDENCHHDETTGNKHIQRG